MHASYATNDSFFHWVVRLFCLKMNAGKMIREVLRNKQNNQSVVQDGGYGAAHVKQQL